MEVWQKNQKKSVNDNKNQIIYYNLRTYAILIIYLYMSYFIRNKFLLPESQKILLRVCNEYVFFVIGYLPVNKLNLILLFCCN